MTWLTYWHTNTACNTRFSSTLILIIFRDLMAQSLLHKWSIFNICFADDRLRFLTNGPNYFYFSCGRTNHDLWVQKSAHSFSCSNSNNTLFSKGLVSTSLKIMAFQVLTDQQQHLFSFDGITPPFWSERRHCYNRRYVRKSLTTSIFVGNQ